MFFFYKVLDYFSSPPCGIFLIDFFVINLRNPITAVFRGGMNICSTGLTKSDEHSIKMVNSIDRIETWKALPLSSLQQGREHG
jgi:hypothetical protein